MRFRNCFGMIWSVSTSGRSSTTACEVTERNAFTRELFFPSRRAAGAPRRKGEPLGYPEAPSPESARARSRRHQVPDVREAARARRRRSHRRTDEMRASPGALPPLEVAVRRRGTPLARREDVRVHSEAHRAACTAPLEAGVEEDANEALGLGLLLHLSRPRDHLRADGG